MNADNSIGIHQIPWAEAQERLDTLDRQNIRRFLAHLETVENEQKCPLTAVLVGSVLDGQPHHPYCYGDVDILLLPQDEDLHRIKIWEFKDFLRTYPLKAGTGFAKAVEECGGIYDSEETWRIILGEKEPRYFSIIDRVS
jgi:hypothetical protein